MDFRMPTVRVAFYVANVGKNLHFLREPRIKHVFIGHGESDKIASVNPFTKVYDEIWVAGRTPASAGPRPTSACATRRSSRWAAPSWRRSCPAGERPPGQPLTVLYAPTWEGWTANPYASSLPTMGPALVRWLLERPTPTRLHLQAAPAHRHGVTRRPRRPTARSSR